MKDSEEAIEKVLAGLRSSEPNVGMERRILDRLQENSSALSGWSWRRWMPIWLLGRSRTDAATLAAFGLGLAGVFAAVLLTPALHWSAHRVGRAPAGLSNEDRVAPPAMASEKIAERAARPAPQPHRRFPTEPAAQQAVIAEDSDAAALREMRAASLPAPPMPLTEQEKLLLRIAHRQDPVELAMLNPEIRARREADAEAEFQNYFEPPAPPAATDSKQDSTTREEGDER